MNCKTWPISSLLARVRTMEGASLAVNRIEPALLRLWPSSPIWSDSASRARMSMPSPVSASASASTVPSTSFIQRSLAITSGL